MKKLLTIFIGVCVLSSVFAQPELGLGQVWHKNPDNPIFLNEGAVGTWNEGTEIGTNMGSCIIWDSLASEYRLYQTGRQDDAKSIGLFTADSLSGPWVEYEHNPIFTADTSFWATYRVLAPHVLYDSGTYKMWFVGMDSTEIGKIGYAESPDGIDWTPLDTAVIAPRDASKWDSYEIVQLFVIKNGENDYIGWYVGGVPNAYQIGCVTSEDGINWSRVSDDPVLSNEDPTSVWMNTIYVMMENGKYLIWYSGANTSFVMVNPGKVCFAISEDGINWRRDKLYNPIFSNGSSGRWDERFVGVSKIIKRDDHYEMLYVGADDDWDHLSYGTAIYKPTEIAGGNVSGTWTEDGSPYRINGSIVIPYGETLTVEPGTVVEFCGYYPLNVQGRLLAEGTASNNIRFWRNDTLSFSNIGGNYGAWSGIIFMDTPSSNDSSIISYCDIAFGKAPEYSSGNYGGGIFVYSFDKLRIENCRIHHNYAIASDAEKGASGGGIYMQDCHILVNKNTIEYNMARHATQAAEASGGGICMALHANSDITNNLIQYNRSTEDGGGISIWSTSSPYLANNLIVKNTSLSFSETTPSGAGGGVAMRYYCSPVLINNTIADNMALRGGGMAIEDCDAIVFNTIIANNEARDVYDQLRLYNVSSRSLKFYYSCLEGDAGTEWEYVVSLDTCMLITADPRLYSTNYHLSSISSPCVCAARRFCSTDGVSIHWAPTTDYENGARPQPEGTYPDIGAIECSAGDVLDPTVNVVSIPDHFKLDQNYPNPFNPRTAISYQLSADRDVELTIYDISGRKIKTLINEQQPAGYYTVNWDASGYSSGIYLYRLMSGNYVETKKMVYIK